MIIRVAKHAGFCFGVKRAVEMAEKAGLSRVGKERVYTLGELIHNRDVVERLESKNVFAINDIDDIEDGALVIIRSHGAPPDVFEKLSQKNCNVVDATCPFVKRIHEIAITAKENSIPLIIVGEKTHPEVIGIEGWGPREQTYILKCEDEVASLTEIKKAVVVSQTTLQKNIYEAVCDALLDAEMEIEVKNTICDTTLKRQSEAIELAKCCDTMLVIGGFHSSNTQKLAELCKKECKNTVFIENKGQLLLEKIKSDGIIGIVAGASAPDWMIREVLTGMNELEKTTAQPTEEVEAQTPAQDAVQDAPVVEEAPVAVEATEPEAAAKDEQPAAETTAEIAKEEESADASEAADPDSFAEAFEKTLVRIRNGQIITGSVVQIVDGEVCVNIGYKSDGFIPRSEFSSDPDVNPSEQVKVGDSIEVEVLKVNDGEGNVLLSRKSVEGKKLWEELVADEELESKTFDAVGKEVVKGGLIATINGVRAFVPASHVSTKYVENLGEFVGKPMRLAVIEVDKQRKRIVASQKTVLLAEAEAEKAEKWKSLEAGAKMQGVVRRLTDFGAFVDIGGIDGLVHVTDIAWGRVKHPSDILKIGQQVEVLVINVDAQKQRVSLGYKQLQPKPWTMAGEKYVVGSIVEGKVVRIVPFGAFVALEPTIDGLIHISQVGVKRIAKVEDEINVGDVVRCKVLDVNSEAKRISLSRKEVILEENPEIAAEIAAERAERDRQYQERQEQRQAERPQQSSAPRSERSFERPQRDARTERARNTNFDRSERPERRRRDEGGDYQLPPVQSTTTSLADLLQNFKVEEDSE